VRDGAPFNIMPLLGIGFEDATGEPSFIGFRVIDRYGLPVPNVAVDWVAGRGSIRSADARTDAFGVAVAEAVLGASPGVYNYRAFAGGLDVDFSGLARTRPTISAGGAVNSASFVAGPGIAPGSYLTIYGRDLSEAAESAGAAVLPLSLEQVTVSFDVPSAGLSLPGRLFYVSPSQVNVQVPWELQGQSSAIIKVSLGDVSGRLYELPLSRFSPGIFEYTGAGRRLAAALDENSNLITAANPARPGAVIQLYANGLGPVSNRPESGRPAAAQPLSRTESEPLVTIDGRRATVLFSGLAPGFAALYQINVAVPVDTPSGANTVTISVGGATSNDSAIVVR
jgi:uncharacterized protein (TIGR03437 family)